MTTYQQQFEKAISGEGAIPPYWLGYFREAFQEAINEQLLEMYLVAARGGLTKKDVAEKLGRRPEQITRWLAAPSNLETDTISDLALAFGCTPVVQLQKVTWDNSSQQRHPLSVRMNPPVSIEASPGYLKSPLSTSAAASPAEMMAA